MNLIYKFPELAFCLGEYRLEDARLGLLENLFSFFPNKKQGSVLVFFDGRKSADPECYSEEILGFSVHYSQEKKADELIIGYLTYCESPSQCLVVTSDKEILGYARRFRAKRKTSDEFYLDWKQKLLEEKEEDFLELKEGLTSDSENAYWERLFLS